MQNASETDASLPLHQYFLAVERRLRRIQPAGWACFRIRLGDQIIEQSFPTEAQAALARKSMVGLVTQQPGPPDAVFRYWADTSAPYLPAGAAGDAAVWQSQDETGYLRITPGYCLVGADLQSRVFYYCRHAPAAGDHMLYGHAMALIFSRWAQASGMLLLHAAAIGAGGRGVLIAALGGGGKSTLALACLQASMDFVADDYTLVSAQGPLRAMPLYRTVGLNPDMAAALGVDLPVVRVNEARGGKLLLDASRYPFCPSLPIGAIVFPRLTDRPDPRLVPAAPGPVLAKLIHSSAKQVGVFRDPEPIRAMAARLSGLPVYEIQLCHDPVKNAEALRIFIEKEIRNV